jgi:protein-tyrosine-phosphatase
LLNDDLARWADIVVTMGCGDACPVIPGRRYIDWDLTDPKDLPIADVRRIRDDIKTRVAWLVEELENQKC